MNQEKKERYAQLLERQTALLVELSAVNRELNDLAGIAPVEDIISRYERRFPGVDFRRLPVQIEDAAR